MASTKQTGSVFTPYTGMRVIKLVFRMVEISPGKMELDMLSTVAATAAANGASFATKAVGNPFEEYVHRDTRPLHFPTGPVVPARKDGIGLWFDTALGSTMIPDGTMMPPPAKRLKVGM